MDRRHKEPLKSKHARKPAPTTFSLSEPSNAAKRQRTSMEPDEISVVTVRGRSPHPQNFGVETLLFTSRSRYLAKCLAEDPYLTVVLRGEEPEIFAMYVRCVKFGTDQIGSLADEYEKSLKLNATRDEKQKAADAVFAKLIDLYLLTRRLDDNKTTHMVIEQIVHLNNDIDMIPSASVDFAYTHTEEGDPLRRVMSDSWIYEAVATGSKRLLAEVYDAEAKRGIGLRLLDHMVSVPGFQQSVVQNWCRDTCRYHDHKENQKCGDGASSNDPNSKTDAEYDAAIPLKKVLRDIEACTRKPSAALTTFR